MTGRRLGVGIIGATGFFGKDWYLDGFQKTPEAEVVAVSARDRAKLDALPTDATRYTDYNDLLADDRVELVVVTTPDATHHSLVLAAAAAGKHVLCEKPLALNAGQAREMVDALERAGRRGFVNFTYRNMPSFSVVAQQVQAGRIGEIRHARVDVTWGAGLARREGTPSWRQQAAHAGPQGVLGDAGSHGLDMLRWMAGNPTALFCQMRIFDPDRLSGGRIDNSDLCLVQGELANGATFSSQFNRVADGPSKFLTLHLLGTEGSLEADIFSVRYLRGGTVEDLPVKQYPMDAARQPEVLQARYVAMPAITRALLHNEAVPHLATISDGLRAQELMDACMRSAQQQAWLEL